MSSVRTAPTMAQRLTEAGQERVSMAGVMTVDALVDPARLRPTMEAAAAVEELRATARELVEERLTLLDRDAGGDLVEIFSRLSIRVMCRLLGVPDGDVEGWGHWADALSPVFGYMDADQIRAAETALG